MISKAIKLIRQYHNLNQAQLASKLSISTSYLSEIESGKKEPSLDILQKYADFFKVPLSSLVVFSETLDGSHSKSKARAFLSKKMLKVLEWISDNDDIKEIKNTP
ncbi:helix-turn-helix domain-containing protein [Candidatus Methylomicrobium oryzae]|uniref:helix-turn-helix domain-containing protein n=1 Tax=Candidatus Methylomicrobium oryzae TaxID=2802053 RepID=UPI0019227ED8|nr:helix-turn-helix transcriptional regulator [Methylomicrobium sp. RS1]MBL1263878.1 helix-turn-helix transcriptional regulator [Methylomicrobium sp. RS1]